MTTRATTLPLCLTSLLFALCACAQSGPRETTAGAIEGRILHPAQAVPAMRICAIGSGGAARPICIDTRAGQDRYRIAGLTADEYTVYAATDDAQYRVGAHVRPVQCIRAPCPDMPAPVTVAAGARATGIDLNGFYPRREDFPALPSAPD